MTLLDGVDARTESPDFSPGHDEVSLQNIKGIFEKKKKKSIENTLTVKS